MNITGARVFFTVFGIRITSTIVNMWIIMAGIFIFCLVFTKDMKTKNISKKQAVAEILVSAAHKFTIGNMGEKYKKFAPFVAAIFSLSALSSLSSLFGFYPATSDLSTVIGWSLLVFAMITYTKIKTNRLSGYLKSFTKPIAVLTPFNIISEVATPVSMAFRHFGSIASGSVIMTLLHGALAALSAFVLQWLPSPISEFGLFEIGLPAFASVYFDIFSGLLQAYIFCMLTTLYISNAAQKD